MNKQVLAIGDLNADLVIHAYTDLNNSSVNHPPQLFGGGTIGNTAVGLARLGVPVAFIGKVGEDIYGRQLVKELKDEGVDTQHILVSSERPTVLIIAYIKEDGEREIYIWPQTKSAHTGLRIEEIPSEIFLQAAWVHTSGLLLNEAPLSETLLEMMRTANKAGIPVSFDLNLRPECFTWDKKTLENIHTAVQLSDYIFGSAREEILPLGNSQKLTEAMRSLMGDKRTIIARQGAEGVQVLSPAESFFTPAFNVPVLDTIGAGDAFNSGFIAARVKGLSLQEAVCWGNAAAGLSIGKEGARQCPRIEDLQKFLQTEPPVLGEK